MQNTQLKLQQKELALQRKELALTRTEIAQATKAHIKHVELVELQIQNQERQLKTAYKPSIEVEFYNKSLIGSSYTFKLTTPFYDCIVQEVLVVDQIQNSVYPNLLSETIRNSSIEDIDNFVQVSIPNDISKCRIIFNYIDIKSNKFHREYSFSMEDRGLSARSYELQGHAFFLVKESGELSKEIMN